MSKTPNVATYDQELTPVVDKVTTPQGAVDRARWTITGLSAGRVYLHIVNLGASGGGLSGIKVTL